MAAGFYEETVPEEADGRGLSAEQLLQTMLQPALTAVHDSAVIRLSPLGMFGVRRLLVAHGWEVTAS